MGRLLDELIAFDRACFPLAIEQHSLQSYKRFIKSPTAIVLYIKDSDNRIIASLIGLLRHYKIASGRVYKIGVLESYRKKGLGTRLLSTFEEFCLKNDMKKIFAEVRESNTASLDMFLKSGYKKSGSLYAYYGSLTDDGDLENGIKLFKYLGRDIQ